MPLDRRQFLKNAGLLAASATLWPRLLRGQDGGETVTLPFDNGERDMAVYPQKRALIRLTSRPPQLETPFSVFNDGIFTPNDAFFVRYHMAGIPTSIDVSTFRVKVHGTVKTPLELSLADLKALGDPVELVAVNQCSGNSRGFVKPRVPGGQSGNGAMGNARWTGVPLSKVLAKAGLGAGAKQVTFNGLDNPILPSTPDFVKALDLDHANDGEVMLAWAMNGEELPMLNGFPLRLIVPGYYGTYWVKHVNDIEVIDNVLANFWMATAYRIPDTPDHSIQPGTAPKATIPINRFAIRSFITNLTDGAHVPVGRDVPVRGIAFDSGRGLREVSFSADGGRSWQAAQLGADQGKYSFREWRTTFRATMPGELTLLARASNLADEIQPLDALWNPSGYMRNVVERTRVLAA